MLAGSMLLPGTFLKTLTFFFLTFFFSYIILYYIILYYIILPRFSKIAIILYCHGLVRLQNNLEFYSAPRSVTSSLLMMSRIWGCQVAWRDKILSYFAILLNRGNII